MCEYDSRETGRGPQALMSAMRARRSQRLEQGVAARDLDLAGRFLDVELLHHAVLDQHGIAPRAGAETIARAVEGEIDRLGELAVAVGQEVDLVGRGRLLPRVHDEDVVDRGDRDGADALRLDGVGVLHDRRHMHLVAGAGEGARDREQRDLLALENLVGGFPRRPVRRHHAKFRLGQSIADLDGHGLILSLTVELYSIAFSGEVGTGSPQKTRQTQHSYPARAARTSGRMGIPAPKLASPAD